MSTHQPRFDDSAAQVKLKGGRPPTGDLLVCWGDDGYSTEEEDLETSNKIGDVTSDREDDDDDDGNENETEQEEQIYSAYSSLMIKKDSILRQSMCRDMVDDEDIFAESFGKTSREEMGSALYAATGSAMLETLKSSAVECRFSDEHTVRTWRKSLSKSMRKMRTNSSIFESSYEATPDENRVIALLEKQLIGPDSALKTMRRRRSSGGTCNLNGVDLASVVLNSHSKKNDEERHSYIQFWGQTVLVKKGPITFYAKVSENGIFFSASSKTLKRSNSAPIENYTCEPKELMLFNNSILVASLDSNVPSSKQGRKDIWNKLLNAMPFNRFVDVCESLGSIKEVVDLSISSYDYTHKDNIIKADEEKDGDLIPFGFRIIFEKKSLTFQCAIEEDKVSWISSLEFALLESKKHRTIFYNEDDADRRMCQLSYDLMRTSVFSAVVKGDEPMLQRLVSKYSTKRLERRDKCGNSLLHYAVQKNRCGCAKILLEAGIDTEKSDFLGKVPGCYASSQEMKSLLIAFGADQSKIPEIWSG